MAWAQVYTHFAQMFIVEETVQDTYEEQAVGQADAILVEISDSPFNPTGRANYETTNTRGDNLQHDEVPGHGPYEMTFRIPMRGSGDTGPTTEPEFTEALKACGLVYAAGPPQTYIPTSTHDGAGSNPGTSYSLTLLDGGASYKVAAAFGNVVFTGEAGMPMFAEFTFTGSPAAVSADALETLTYDTVVAPLFKGASFSTNFGGAYVPQGIASFSLDLGNNVVYVDDVNAAEGGYARIRGRKSVGSFESDGAAIGTQAWYGIYEAATAGTITTGTVGGTAGNQWKIDVARCTIRPPEMGALDNIRRITNTFAVSSATTDVEDTNADITISFT